MELVTNPLNPTLMKKTVKPLVLLTICALFFIQSPAQLKMPVAAGISSDIKKIIKWFEYLHEAGITLLPDPVLPTAEPETATQED